MKEECKHIWLHLPKKRNNTQFFWCMKCLLSGNKINNNFELPLIKITRHKLDVILNRFDY